jgi:hypothetical protein
MGDDETVNQVKFPLADLKLEERDKLSAVEFTFDSAEAMTQFVGACGISVDNSKVQQTAGVTNGWYQTGNIAVINTDGNFKVMWIIPEAIRNGVYPEGDVLMGYWYGDKEGGETVETVTISDVKYHIYRATEEDLVVPEEVELTVGETYDIPVNIDGAEFSSERGTVATVDKNGKVTAVGEGLSKITVTTPEGQEAIVTVIVKAKVTTPAVTTTVTTTTTKVTTTQATTTVTTTVDPDTIVDYSRVLYGDVNLDNSVTVADVVTLSKHLVNAEIFPLANATAMENANTLYDDVVNSSDNLKIIEYNTGKLTLLDLGPEDKSNCPLYKELGIIE